MRIQDVVVPAVYEVTSRFDYQSSAMIITSVQRYRMTVSRYRSGGLDRPVAEAGARDRPGRNRGYGLYDVHVGLLGIQVPTGLDEDLRQRAEREPNFDPIAHPEVIALIEAAGALTVPFDAAIAEPAVTVVPTRDLLGELVTVIQERIEKQRQEAVASARHQRIEDEARQRYVAANDRAAALGVTLSRHWDATRWRYAAMTIGDLEKLLNLAERGRLIDAHFADAGRGEIDNQAGPTWLTEEGSASGQSNG